MKPTDFWEFASVRLMQLKTGIAADCYHDWLIRHGKPIKLIVSTSRKAFCNFTAERVARKLGGRYCYDENWRGIVLIPLKANDYQI